MMRWADALPEVKLRFEDEMSMGATFADFFSGAAPGCSPGSTQLRATILYPAPFAALRELAATATERWDGTHTFTRLSMGTSQDFEVAVEEGATLVRAGSVLLTP